MNARLLLRHSSYGFYTNNEKTYNKNKKVKKGETNYVK